jgi:hypothetical protein
MNQRLFFILNGNNGATYIINTANWIEISESLKFYRAYSLKSRVLKEGLRLFLWSKTNFYPKRLKIVEEMQEYLQSLSQSNINFQLDTKFSVLVSPTRDKVIVNHHSEYFQKFAFGKSYRKVKNEANIYSLFKKPLKHFQVSEFYDAENRDAQLCSFKLSNSHLITTKSNSSDLVPALVEFFQISQVKNIKVDLFLEKLMKQTEFLELGIIDMQAELLKRFNDIYGNWEVPLGLVHRDFKPWNILNYGKILIFDFEEAITDGLPLEDMFNFYCDPIIRYQETPKVAEVMLDTKMIERYNAYLKELNITLGYDFFLHIYLIERIIFWSNAKEPVTSNSYLNLSNYLINNSRP